ncbi:hypothetical protein EBL85_06015 [Marichromatium sp. AB32]|nr:hypothetical protein EBL85_06015 [Marichromatium sp. AB32]
MPRRVPADRRRRQPLQRDRAAARRAGARPSRRRARSATVRVGLLGASGELGGVAARVLLDGGLDTLRLGARDRRRAETLAAELRRRAPGARIETRAVDLTEPASALAFAADCGVLVNCAGPARDTSRHAALAAIAAGVDLVDASAEPGIAALFERAPARTALLGAGLQPGLTGLLPRWLAGRGFARVTRLRSYLRVFDRFTATAATDFLHATDAGCLPLAAWRSGPRGGALARRSAVELPFFDAPATLLPYLDQEAMALAGALGLEHGDWFSVVSAPQVLDAFDRAPALEPEAARAALERASALDLLGRRPRIQLLVELAGRDPAGRALTRCALVDGVGNATVSGTLIALATGALVDGALTPGAGFAALALDPEAMLAGLRAQRAIEPPQWLDGGVEDLAVTEEGAL